MRQTVDRITALDVFGNEHRVDLASLTWRPSVYGIVIEDGKILMPKQFKTKYDLPGGGVEIGEALEDAVIREVKEETGIDVKVVRLIAVRSSIFTSAHDDSPKNYHSLLFYYLCKKVGGELSIGGLDEYEKNYAEMAEWVPIEKLDKIDMPSTVDCKPIIKEAITYGD